MAKRTDDDEPKDENLSNDSDDSFGLPEIEYEPIRKQEENVEETPEPEQPEETYEPEVEESVVTSEYEENPEPVQEEVEHSYRPTYEEEESSIWPKLIAILAVIVIALAATWYFVLYKPQQDAKEKARIEQQQKDAAALKAKEEEESKLRMAREAVEKRRLDSLAAIVTPVAGAIETLSERTGRYYVVVASALDSDLLMDYARKLSDKGVGSRIIPPYGKHKVSRLTIAEGDSFNAAQAKADELKAEYGDALWVLKY
jgi:hypothetical protein